jgi:uncharacterized protein YukE
MSPADLSSAACLRILMEEQASRIEALANRVSEARMSGLRVAPSEQWTGLSREVHDEFVRQLTAQLDQVRSALDRAAVESRHAAATLASRV